MHVGMNRTSGSGPAAGGRVPHARGDEPINLFAGSPVDRSSPCTWG